jgi:hypothetical protein
MAERATPSGAPVVPVEVLLVAAELECQLQQARML